MVTGTAAFLRHWLYDWGGLNAQLMLWVNRSDTAEGIGIAGVLSAIGSYWGAPVMMLLLLCWQARLRTAAAAIAPFRFLAGLGAAMLAAAIAKSVFAYPRPAEVFGNELPWVVGSPDSLHAFPSGHAVYTAVVLATFWPLVCWPWRAALLLLAVAVGWSRIALGAHFPADVLAGFLLGVACVAATRRPAEAMAHAAKGWLPWR